MYEQLITAHLIEYINDDRLFKLPLSTIYRIQQQFLKEYKEENNSNSKENQNQTKIRNRTIIDFLIKTASLFDIESSLFITANKFNQDQILYLNEQMNQIEDENTKEILTKFLYSNPSFLIEYQKNEKASKEKEIKKYEKIIEELKKEQEKKEYEIYIKDLEEKFISTIKRIDNELILLFYNFNFKIPIGLPNSPTKIFQKQFEQFPFIEITLPNNIEIIEKQAFNGCQFLTSILIPSSVKTIESQSFSGCSSLTSISIPSSVTTIGTQSFKGCSKLTSISIPFSVTTIESQSFSECLSLKEITIQPSVTLIGEQAFNECSNLKQITIDPYSTKIQDNSFENCKSLNHLIMSTSTSTITSYQLRIPPKRHPPFFLLAIEKFIGGMEEIFITISIL